MKKKNLIFFLPDFVCGGAGKSITSLCKNLDKNKFQISIICLNKCYYKSELKSFCNIYEIYKSKALFAQSEIKKIIKKNVSLNKENIFISNLFYANALTALFQKKYSNLKFVFTERTAFKELSIYFGVKDFIKKNIIKLILKLFYKKADLVIANSKKVAFDIKNFSNVKTKFVYPGSFKKTFKRKKLIKKKLNIISIGRISEEKGFDVLIKAFKKIDKNKYDLCLIGDGKERKNILNLINKYQLHKNIKVIGFKSNIYPYLKKSDLLINPSYFEGFPNVVIEALSCGVPVICSKSHGGIYEILNNEKYGDLFENGSAIDLENKINNFLKNPKKLKSKSLKSQQTLKRFSEIQSAKKYEKIFLNL
jgi:glycosyltransferase involved in cell wall biosynthesis